MLYKVIYPTNGHQPGEVIEITEAEAANFNAGEAHPRLEPVKEVANEATAPTESDPKVEEAPVVVPEPTNAPAEATAPTDAAGGEATQPAEAGASAEQLTP